MMSTLEEDERPSGDMSSALSWASEMTSPAVVRRLQARKALLLLQETIPEGYVPPKQLLLYLVRMGSISSVPKVPNEDAQDDDLDLPQFMTREELILYCAAHLEGTPSLIQRTFASSQNCDTFLHKFRNRSLRIFQWNILAQSLGVNNDNFICCPDDALDWDRRKHLLVQEIVTYSPDIICLQEVDHFKFLRKTLSTQGYDGIFFPKPDSPCLYNKGNNGPDGCAIFFSTGRFELVSTHTRVLQVWSVQSNQVAVIAVVRARDSGKELAVVTTHLKARSGALLAALRNEQGKDLLEFVTSVAGQTRPILLCGDFNATPSEPVYKTILNHPRLPLASAYAAFSGSEPPYTTWKIRPDGEHCQTIDYIFFTKDTLKVHNVLAFPSEADIGVHRVPSYSYPSDHFSLCCDFLIN